MEISTVEVNKILVPKYMIYKSELHLITNLDRKYVSKGYIVELADGKIFNVILKGIHPNSNPDNNDFCIPESLYDKEFTDDLKSQIENMIRTFNVDDCYFTPWGGIEYIRENMYE